MAEKSTVSDAAQGPLHGLKVLDLTSVVLGPYATQILGDYGADVVKVEPLDGDLMRANGVSRTPGMSSIFLSINRNKRSIALDLKAKEGRDIFLALAERSDIVLHNMRQPAVERLDISYEAVRARNERIIYCAATGFGQSGPDRNKPAFDDIIQSACGLASLNRLDGTGPQYVPTLIADKTVGMAVVSAVLAALYSRTQTGRGQYIEVPMLETMVEFVMVEHLGGLTFDPPEGPPGYQRISNGGRRPVPTSDGYVTMLPYSPRNWTELFSTLGREDLLHTFDLSSRHAVNASVKELYQQLAKITPQKNTEEWLRTCEVLDIPATALFRLEDLQEHPHLKAVEHFQTMEHPSEGLIRFVKPSTVFSRTPARVHRGAPCLGQDTDAVLAELGYSPADIETLLSKKIILRGSVPYPIDSPTLPAKAMVSP